MEMNLGGSLGKGMSLPGRAGGGSCHSAVLDSQEPAFFNLYRIEKNLEGGAGTDLATCHITEAQVVDARRGETVTVELIVSNTRCIVELTKLQKVFIGCLVKSILINDTNLAQFVLNRAGNKGIHEILPKGKHSKSILESKAPDEFLLCHFISAERIGILTRGKRKQCKNYYYESFHFLR